MNGTILLTNPTLVEKLIFQSKPGPRRAQLSILLRSLNSDLSLTEEETEISNSLLLEIDPFLIPFKISSYSKQIRALCKTYGWDVFNITNHPVIVLKRMPGFSGKI